VLERRHDAWSRLFRRLRGIEHETLRLPALADFDPTGLFLEGALPARAGAVPARRCLSITVVLILLTALQVLEQQRAQLRMNRRGADRPRTKASGTDVSVHGNDARLIGSQKAVNQYTSSRVGECERGTNCCPSRGKPVLER
jgi:hypothetical protein